MAAEWYFQIGGATRGPVSSDELKRLVGDGTVTRQTMLRRSDMAAFVPAARIETLWKAVEEPLVASYPPLPPNPSAPKRPTPPAHEVYYPPAAATAPLPPMQAEREDRGDEAPREKKPHDSNDSLTPAEREAARLKISRQQAKGCLFAATLVWPLACLFAFFGCAGMGGPAAGVLPAVTAVGVVTFLYGAVAVFLLVLWFTSLPD